MFIARALCGIECNSKTPCVPFAVRKSVSNGDQQLCMKLEDQCYPFKANWSRDAPPV